MQVPPPIPTAPKRKSNAGLIIAVIAVAVCVPCILMMVFVTKFAQQGAGMVSEMGNCGIAMQTLHTATEKYALANGGKLPPAQNWQAALAPFFDVDKDMKEVEEVPFFNLKAPNITKPMECSAKAKTGISYNAAIAGKEMQKIVNPSTTMLFYEVPTQAMNQAAPYKELDKNSAPDRGFGVKGWVSISVDGDSHGFGDSKSSGKRRITFESGN